MSIWGDGFADDGWHDLMTVRNWNEVCRDECVRLFPRLVREAVAVPDMVAAALDEAIERASARRSAPLPHLEPPFVVTLSAIRDEARSGTIGLPAPAVSAAFAFGTAMHPAYLWPSEALAAERGTFLAWLGVLDRGRPALMPVEVADYLCSTVAWADGRPSALRDGSVAPFVRVDARLADLVAAARRTLAGEPALVQPRRAGWISARLAAVATFARHRAAQPSIEAFARASEGKAC